MADDVFALYAQKADDIGEGLYMPEPIPHTPVFCDLQEGAFVPTQPMPTISNEAQLKEALADLRLENPPAKHLYRNLMAL